MNHVAIYTFNHYSPSTNLGDFKLLENQFIYPSPKGSKLIFFAPLGVGVNEENQ
jgi:hypothetical protein